MSLAAPLLAALGSVQAAEHLAAALCRGQLPTWEDTGAHGKWVILSDKRDSIRRLGRVLPPPRPPPSLRPSTRPPASATIREEWQRQERDGGGGGGG